MTGLHLLSRWLAGLPRNKDTIMSDQLHKYIIITATTVWSIVLVELVALT